MEKLKKLNKLKVGIIIFLIVFAFSIAVFGRFIYNTVIEAYFSARQFYFSSNILILNGENDSYTYNNWGGVGEYEIGFELYSYNNQLSKLNYPLDYTVTCKSLDSRIECTIAQIDDVTPNVTTAEDGTKSAEGTIQTTTHASGVVILVTPIDGAQINEGETVELVVTASTSVPYQKTISRKFSLYINLPEGNSFTIEDVAGRDYALLQLVNRSESATQVELQFDPNELRLDMNDEIYTDTDKLVSVETTTISGETYINEIIFNIDGEASKNVKFYKVDKAQNYSYPGEEEESAITVNY